MAKSGEAVDLTRRVTAAWHTRVMTATTGFLMVRRASAANAVAAAGGLTCRRRRQFAAREGQLCHRDPKGIHANGTRLAGALVLVTRDGAADAGPTTFASYQQ